LSIPELVDVGDRFVLRPLLPLLTNNVRCLLLALSRNLVRVFEATLFEIRDITPAAMPTDLRSALKTDQVDRGSQVHSAMPVPHGKQAAVFHGQGGQADTIKDETAHFFRLVDDALGAVPAHRGLPLILAGVESDLALFRSVTSHSNLVQEHVRGNTDHLSEHQVHQLALPAIQAVSSRLQTAAISRLREANGRSSHAIADILPAVQAGRVDTLFVRGNDNAWGKFLPDTMAVHLHSTRQPGDDDLLEWAVLETASRGGTVFVLPPDELSDSPIAAIYRY